MKNTVGTFRQQKEKGDKITMLTCYDYSTAKVMDAAGVNSLLVGDSLGMVMLGYPDTLSVTMEDILHHTKAVVRGAEDALVVADMPFLSYQVSIEKAVENAGRFIKEAGAHAVKLEGGASVAEQIRAIVKASIPVVGHIGLTPQSINAFGGFKVQGKTLEAARAVLEDALAVQEAGAFAVVLEAIPAALAAVISKRLDIPTIGIGAGAGCDGQVLVYQDMLNLYGGLKPKFVKVFGDAGAVLSEAFAAYIRETKAGSFPAEEHCFASELDEAALRGLSES
ncbi:MAG: 3-methyl-2-oxobutanoate hydroxymethyltransferase [Clostridiales Family XIII bacterium]|jgi:3-methyl-2-oxobutanoate hydroxymethyltransferase|nr:3-methyl-2-oxobutanoate hydroxymethyltransferase [Clostridiales Family XIII bacterium]